MTNLEIFLVKYKSIIYALIAGADRLEFCSALGVEGLTPYP
ncbi:copper homeostasis protein CutC, partial [Francisella tularensis subsp. holarctica]